MKRGFLSVASIFSMVLAAMVMWLGWRFGPRFGANAEVDIALSESLARIGWAVLLSVMIAVAQRRFEIFHSWLGAAGLGIGAAGAMMFAAFIVNKDSSTVESMVVRGLVVLVASLIVHLGRRVSGAETERSNSGALPR